MTQCLCAFPTIALFIICDALTLSIRTWTEVHHYQNYPSQGTPNLQVIHGPSRKPSHGSLQSMGTHRIALDPHSCSGLCRCRKCSVLGLCFKTFFKFVFFATDHYISTSLNFTKLHHHFARCARPVVYFMLQCNPHNPLHLLTSTGDTVSKC